MERSEFKGGSEWNPGVKATMQELPHGIRSGVEYTLHGNKPEAEHERVYTVAVEQKVELERYCFTATIPGKGTVAVETYGEELSDVIEGFRGFLVTLGFNRDSINTEMGREW